MTIVAEVDSCQWEENNENEGKYTKEKADYSGDNIDFFHNFLFHRIIYPDCVLTLPRLRLNPVKLRGTLSPILLDRHKPFTLCIAA